MCFLLLTFSVRSVCLVSEKKLNPIHSCSFIDAVQLSWFARRVFVLSRIKYECNSSDKNKWLHMNAWPQYITDERKLKYFTELRFLLKYYRLSHCSGKKRWFYLIRCNDPWKMFCSYFILTWNHRNNYFFQQFIVQHKI